MKYIITLFVLILFSGRIRAQGSIPQITLGGGVGVSTAFAGTEVQKTNLAWFAEAGYYPGTYVVMTAEEQIGTFSGASLNPNGVNPKSFINNYNATIFNIGVAPTIILNDKQSALANVLKNIYLGTGLGLLFSNITNVNFYNIQAKDHINNFLPIVPLKSQYEYSIVNNRQEAVLKLDLSSAFYYAIGKGIDGYYDSFARHGAFYYFLNIGIKYPFNLDGGSGRPYNQ